MHRDGLGKAGIQEESINCCIMLPTMQFHPLLLVVLLGQAAEMVKLRVIEIDSPPGAIYIGNKASDREFLLR